MTFCQHAKKTLNRMVLSTFWTHRRAIRVLLLMAVLCVAAPVLIYRIFTNSDLDADNLIQSNKYGRDINAYRNSKDALDVESNYVSYNKNIPLIWIGGVPRSGTTLARAMLDAHPHIRCGEETRVIPRMLSMHAHMLKSDLERARLEAAKVTDDVIDSALGAYMLSIIVGHGEPARRLCNKDPFTLKSMPRLLNIFPNSKFILMVRDGRATVHSIVTRKVTIRGFNHTSYAAALRDWNRATENMYTSCMKQTKSTCLPVRYEQLVLHPRNEMRKILNFLNIEWNEAVLHHEEAIGKAGGISLSERELSTDQVDKPVNVGALTKWAEHFPDEVKKDVDELAPMLKQLGYDSKRYPPFYGTPDKEVAEQSKRLQQAPER